MVDGVQCCLHSKDWQASGSRCGSQAKRAHRIALSLNRSLWAALGELKRLREPLGMCESLELTPEAFRLRST